jgi:phosphoglycerol transferase MdoB-like AlkP superfamily enzyme
MALCMKKINNYIFFFILLLFAIILAIVEGGFPIKRFSFNYSCFILIFCSAFLITQRKIFSALFAGTSILLVLLISFKKIDLMGSRLNSSDILFAFQNPIFIFQFLDAISTLTIALLCGTLILAFKFDSKSVRLNLPIQASLLLVSIFYISQALTKAPEVYKNGLADNIKNGNILYFALTFSQRFALNYPEPTPEQVDYCCAKANLGSLSVESNYYKPNIVIILMESTFDVSLLNNSIKSSFKKLPHSAIKTYVVGGGTWVQEYAVLHGVPPPTYGEYFKAINTLGVGHLEGRIAPSLKSAGYKTKTFSTSRKDFYGAERFHKSLGIDEYYSLENIPDSGERTIGYKDKDLFRYLIKNLNNEPSPSFAFVTTELNHAPHNYFNISGKINCDHLTQTQCGLLSDYHIREEAFFSTLHDFLKSLSNLNRETIVILFGDHIPADINAEFSEKDFEGRKYETIALFYKSSISSFLEIEKVLGCRPSTLEISDIDALAFKMSGINTTYSNAKIAKKINQACIH